MGARYELALFVWGRGPKQMEDEREGKLGSDKDLALLRSGKSLTLLVKVEKFTMIPHFCFATKKPKRREAGL